MAEPNEDVSIDDAIVTKHAIKQLKDAKKLLIGKTIMQVGEIDSSLAGRPAPTLLLNDKSMIGFYDNQGETGGSICGDNSECSLNEQIGQKITNLYYLSDSKMKQLKWSNRPICFELENGHVFYGAQDDECNDGGEFIYYGNKIVTFYAM